MTRSSQSIVLNAEGVTVILEKPFTIHRPEEECDFFYPLAPGVLGWAINRGDEIVIEQIKAATTRLASRDAQRENYRDVEKKCRCGAIKPEDGSWNQP